MKSKLRLLPVVVLLLVYALPAQAESPVWRVERDGSVMFIGGTIHLLGESDFPLPTAFEMAYQQSTKLVFETDIDAMNAPETSMKMLQSVSYTDGRELRDDLTAENYQAIEQFFTQRGVPMSQVSGYKPGMVSVMMTMVELQLMGQAGAGVDEYFNTRARNDNKARAQLESLDAQLDFIANLGVGQEDAFIEYTLKDLAQLPQFLKELKTAWRAGDLDNLSRIGIEPMQQEFPGVYRDMIVDRNNDWLNQMDRMLETETVELVLVGALHLAGPDGLIEYYLRRGDRVTQLQ